MTSEPTIHLVRAGLKVALSPAIGGAISGFQWLGNDATLPILRPCEEPLTDVLSAACFPLVPYVNRIRGGRFAFRGREVSLHPNMAGDPSPLHGQGWQNPWRVTAADQSSAILRYEHRSGEWPWDYEAVQELDLDEGGLRARLTCTNRSAEPMPCGLGFHPYFPCGAQTRIDTAVTHAWTIDEHVLPAAQVPAAGRYDLRARLVCGQGLDNGWGGWGGSARLNDPDWPYDLRMSSPEARFFQLYSPRTGGIFVAEPVTHANAALNQPEEQWPQLGLRVLAPGEAMSLSMRLDVEPK